MVNASGTVPDTAAVFRCFCEWMMITPMMYTQMKTFATAWSSPRFRCRIFTTFHHFSFCTTFH